MKIKTDFTTNSSSSSFVVLTKVPMKKGKANIQEIFEKLVGKSKLFPNLAKDISEAFANEMTYTTLKEYLEDRGYPTLEEAEADGNNGGEFDTIKKNIKNYPSLYTGSFADDGWEVTEKLLCDAEIDYKDENIVIYKAGGY